MAHLLPGARSILCLRSTRSKAGTVSSNIPWSYGHSTIPRHLRDVVVTEYGIADLRSKTDSEVIAALVEIMDSRFQEELVRSARNSGKLPGSYRIPDRARNDAPAHRWPPQLQALQGWSLFTKYPFGSDLTAEEQALGRALRWLQAETSTPSRKIAALARALRTNSDATLLPLLARMQLDRPASLKERMLQKLMALALLETR